MDDSIKTIAEEYMSVSQVASECGVECYQVRNMLKRDSSIPRVKVGWNLIIPKSQIEAIKDRFTKRITTNT